MHVDKALEQISEIHTHLARGQFYRGYRAVPTVTAGVLALVAAGLQPLMMGGASGDARGFVIYWLGIGLLAAMIAGGGIVAGFVRERDRFARRRTITVVGQLAPALVVAAGMTLAFLWQGDAGLIAYSPALWALLYGLGLVASRPFLPKMIGWLALYFMLCGALLLERAVIMGSDSLAPWAVGLPFGVGHILGGAILYWNLERRNHGA